MTCLDVHAQIHAFKVCFVVVFVLATRHVTITCQLQRQCLTFMEHSALAKPHVYLIWKA